VLEDLEPGSEVAYALRVEGETPAGGGPLRTRVPPRGDTAETLRFVVMGDAGTGNDVAMAVRDAVARELAERPAHAVLVLGDYAYPTGSEAEMQEGLFDVFGPLMARVPFWPVLGNHEEKRSFRVLQEGPFFELFTLPAEVAQIACWTKRAIYGLLFQASAAAAGIDLQVQREPKDGYWNDVWNKKPFCSCYWGPRPIEDMILSIAYLSDAPWNDSVIKIDRVDELVKAARGELDAAKRNEMYAEVQMLISKNGGTLIPAFGQDVAAVDKNAVGIGPKLGGGWEMDGGHFIKRWWMTA